MKVARMVQFFLALVVLFVLTSASVGLARMAKWQPFPPLSPTCPANDMMCW